MTPSKQELAELTRLAMSESPNAVDLAQLKASIQSGQYQPDLERLADRLLGGDGARPGHTN